MKKILFIFSFCVGLVYSSDAQEFIGLTKIGDLFQMYDQDATLGKRDVTNYLEGYLNPMMKGVGFGLANGWFATSETHQLGGFDFSITMTAAHVPGKDSNFTIDSLYSVTPINLQEFPTIMGDLSTPRFSHNNTGSEISGMPGTDMEQAVGARMIPLPMIQLGVGLIKKTDLKIRFIPKIQDSYTGVSFNLMGLGVMHNLSQYIPGAEDFSFNLSGFAGFTKMKVNADLSAARDNSQTAEFNVYSSTLQVVASQDISIVTLYTNIGASNANLGLDVKGQYSTDGDTATLEIEDPLNLRFHAFTPKLGLGAKVNFVLMTFNLDYSFQKYGTLTAGIGFTLN